MMNTGTRQTPCLQLLQVDLSEKKNVNTHTMHSKVVFFLAEFFFVLKQFCIYIKKCKSFK